MLIPNLKPPACGMVYFKHVPPTKPPPPHSKGKEFKQHDWKNDNLFNILFDVVSVSLHCVVLHSSAEWTKYVHLSKCNISRLIGCSNTFQSLLLLSDHLDIQGTTPHESKFAAIVWSCTKSLPFPFPSLFLSVQYVVFDLLIFRCHHSEFESEGI